MPPKAKFSREQITKAALSVVSEKGSHIHHPDFYCVQFYAGSSGCSDARRYGAI